MPWLRDHQMGSQIIFPGAGYCAMAVEAVYQTSMITKWNEKEPERYRYRFRDIRFLRALVLEEAEAATYTLRLTPARDGSTREWYEFRVCSTKSTVYTEHCAGLVCVETDYKETPAPPSSLEPLQLATPGSMIYKAVRESGYNYGPCFQKHLLFEATMGQTKSRSTVSMEPPPSKYGQSFYPVHPSSIDACFYIGILAISKGDIPLVGAVHVPQILSSLVIPARKEQPAEAIALTYARFLGIGRDDLHRNYGSDLSLYDPKDGALLFEMKGLTTRDIETSEEEGAKHLFTHLAWEADLPLLRSEAIVADVEFDIVIVKISDPVEEATQDAALRCVSKSVRARGIVLGISHGMLLEKLGSAQALGEDVYISQVEAEKVSDATPPTVSYNLLKYLATLKVLGGTFRKPATEIASGQLVVVLDELFAPIMDQPTHDQWQALKHIVQKQSKILWVTSGAHLEVTNPTAAAVTGFFRTVRAEEGVRLITLDVEHPAGEATANAIASCLDLLRQPESEIKIENEFVERGGILQISRLVPDWALTKLQGHHPTDRKTEDVDLHASDTTIQLGAERLGDLDSIHYHEISPEPTPLQDGYVEIEVYAAGLNYKDVVVTMGIVPGDERELGGEAAGIVTKVSSSVTSFQVRQRVVVFTNATIANRVRSGLVGSMHFPTGCHLRRRQHSVGSI
ncbi:MAG: hypothetical protein M1818_008385 [Claussenomyces sp. TS43310]|nr:MAG: hypothetical protein M1818_008385 [Claussenomyces sp. TS43310]